MLAEKGEKLEAKDAARMIDRFCPFVKTEYFSCRGGRRGVVSIGSSSRLFSRTPGVFNMMML